MHARVAASTPDYPFSDSFEDEFSEVRGQSYIYPASIARITAVEIPYMMSTMQVANRYVHDLAED